MRSRTDSYLPRYLTALLLAVALPSTGTADIRQHVLGDVIPDTATLISELTAPLNTGGFSLSTNRDAVEGTVVGSQSLSFRHVEYSCYHMTNATSITVGLYLLTDPDREKVDALVPYVRANGYGQTTLRLRGIGAMTWYEYNASGVASTQTLDSVLMTWRDRYVEPE